MPTQERNPELVDLLSADFALRNEPNVAWGNVISNLLLLPGVRAVWPMSVEVDVNPDGSNKITADTATLVVGGTASAVADLQVAFDGNIYAISEVAAAPGIDLIVDFVSVTEFSWVRIIGNYDGATTHATSIQLYNWITTAWDTFDSHDGIEKTMTDHSFRVLIDSNYIGTGGNLGDVRVRFNHTMMGNNAHDLYLDVVALYF